MLGDFLLEFRFLQKVLLGAAGSLPGACSPSVLEDWQEFYSGNAHVFRLFASSAAASADDGDSKSMLEHVLRQQALNVRDSSDVASQDKDSRGKKTNTDSPPTQIPLSWTNKDQRKTALETTVQLSGNNSWIWTAAVSPDYKHIALGCSDAFVHVLSTESWEEVITLGITNGHTGELSHCLFLTENLLLSVATCKPYKPDNDVILWDIRRGNKLFSWEARGGCFSLQKVPVQTQESGMFTVLMRTGEFFAAYEVNDLANQKVNEEGGEKPARFTRELAHWQLGRGGLGCDGFFSEDRSRLFVATGVKAEIRMWCIPATRNYAGEDAEVVEQAISDPCLILKSHTDNVVDFRFLGKTYCVSISSDYSLKVWALFKIDSKAGDIQGSSSSTGFSFSVLATVPNLHGSGIDMMSLTVFQHGEGLSTSTSTYSVITCADDKTLRLYDISIDEGKSTKSGQTTGTTSAGKGSGKGKKSTGSKQASTAATTNAEAPGSSSGTAKVKHCATLEGNASTVKTAQVMRNRCFSCSDDGVVRVYRLDTARENHQQPAVKRAAVGTSSGGAEDTNSNTASADKDKRAKLGNLPALAGPGAAAGPRVGTTKASSSSTSPPDAAPPQSKLPAESYHKPHAVSSCAFLSESHVASADIMGRVRLWDNPYCQTVVWTKVLKSANELNMTAVSSLAVLPSPTASNSDAHPTSSSSGGGLKSLANTALFCAMFRIVHVLRASDGVCVLSCSFPDWINALSTSVNNGSRMEVPPTTSSQAILAGGDSYAVAWACPSKELLTDILLEKKKRLPADSVLPWKKAQLPPKVSQRTAVLCVAGAAIERGGSGTNQPDFLVAAGSNDNQCRVWLGSTADLLFTVSTADASWVVSACFLSGPQQNPKQTEDALVADRDKPQHHSYLICGSQEGELVAFRVDTSSGEAGGADKAKIATIAQTSALFPGSANKPTIAWCEACDFDSFCGPAVQPNEGHEEYLFAVALSSKFVYVCSLSVSDAEGGDQKNEFRIVGYFPGSGPFGSADGIGGQGTVCRNRICIGDQTGELYSLQTS
ncbi:unnamed protein product [Amoebophrya sp. A120]|nr:unnamed protein product [Amoebophrya sp. A120]|eukprot:GSA120T00018768001.1